ncbi:SMI1/KNR4 family protein [Hymenobacter metallicola]|uniref:Knr4/Smi1-like domain-containing protein n=1 Tax=Hymenobacter metallicola TaxID=2563114 RepID=A0A4Z0QEW1_9BACT|nr:SMI1/KNR4 family protein [Hymenobacter metallicola]TGE28560.1 hypothetical protein E5K02_03595 [Hymenobacter metallicola]
MTFSALLTRLDTLLQQRRPDYYATLKPAAPAAELAAFEAEFGLTLPAELRLWFGWRNGQQGFESFVQNNCLQSLDSAAETMRVNRELLEAGDFVPNWWQPGWVPFLENGGGDHVCLDSAGTFTGRAGQVLKHWHDWEARPVLFPDLTAWLAAVVQAYEQTENGTELLRDEQIEDVELAHPPGFPLEFEAG